MIKTKKSIKELQTLNTKNLLRFYKAERNRMFQKGYRYQIIDEDENCDLVMGWVNDSKSKTFSEDINFLYSIKNELNEREHIKRITL
jgi:hypothetical protein